MLLNCFYQFALLSISLVLRLYNCNLAPDTLHRFVKAMSITGFIANTQTINKGKWTALHRHCEAIQGFLPFTQLLPEIREFYASEEGQQAFPAFRGKERRPPGRFFTAFSAERWTSRWMDFKFYWRTNGAQRFLTRYGQNKSRTRQPINGYLMRFFGGGRRGTRRCAKLFPRSAEKDAARAADFFLLFSFAPKQVLTRSQTKGKSPLVRALSFGGRNGTRTCDLSRVRRTL